MSVAFNHTIVWCREPEASASFLTGILGLPEAARRGHFLAVELANGVTLDFAAASDPVAPQHYAFQLSKAEFEQAYARIVARQLPYWADPGRQHPGRINCHGGGRGLYFDDPDGHILEIFTAFCRAAG